MKTQNNNNFYIRIIFAAASFSAITLFALNVMAQTDQICAPNEISGCKVCNAAGTDWINDNLKCAIGQICINGECVANCRDECPIAGLKECRDKGYHVCVKSESTGCLHWSGVFSCLGGQICAGGICVGAGANADKLILSEISPIGAVQNEKIIMKVSTNIAANCRYDIINHEFDAMRGNFQTLNYLSHFESMVLEKTGKFVFYIKCRDKNGNVGAASASFDYIPLQKTADPVPKIEVIAPPSAVKSLPVISSPAPSGKIEGAEIEISVATDKAAQCNYDIFDTDYDSMENSLIASDNGLDHRHKIILPNPGKYTYYVRCANKTGNKNPSSAKINFEYVIDEIADNTGGPNVQNLSPAGAIYQSEILLMLATDAPAQCRYSISDGEFEKMAEVFATDDGLFHEAMISLDNYGNYNYYARCEDANGSVNSVSEIISFQYQDPGVIDFSKGAADAICGQYSLGEEDGACDYNQNCVCDPDCKRTGEYDPDCDYIAAPQKNAGKFIVFGAAIFAGLAIVIAAVIIISKKIKKNPKTLPTDESEFVG